MTNYCDECGTENLDDDESLCEDCKEEGCEAGWDDEDIDGEEE